MAGIGVNEQIEVYDATLAKHFLRDNPEGCCADAKEWTDTGQTWTSIQNGSGASGEIVLARNEHVITAEEAGVWQIQVQVQGTIDLTGKEDEDVRYEIWLRAINDSGVTVSIPVHVLDKRRGFHNENIILTGTRLIDLDEDYTYEVELVSDNQAGLSGVSYNVQANKEAPSLTSVDPTP